MARLIDADAFKTRLEHEAWSRGPIELLRARDIADETPTVDAVPVKHAYVVWTIKNSSYHTQCCSNCHRTFISRPDETIEFCPHCGAKMDDQEGESKS